MNLEKIKWKAALRAEQLKNIRKLIKLELDKKLGKYKGEEFSYHMFKKSYKGWLHVDAEREYLEAHGLIEPEPEEEEYVPEPEPEKEPEPGLVFEMDDYTLMMLSISSGEMVYRPNIVKEYEDIVRLSIVRIDENFEEAEFSLELNKEGRVLPFEIEGVQLSWDCADRALRLTPVYDEVVTEAVNEHLSIIDGKVLAADKDYAESALSELCRSYAFKSDEKAYYWSMEDNRNCTVIFELNNELYGNIKDIGRRNYGKLQLYCRSFADANADKAEELFYKHRNKE